MPQFAPGITKTAKATLTNPTAKQFVYSVELYLGAAKAATSGVGQVTIPPSSSVDVRFTIVMPTVEGTYSVYLDVWLDTSLLKHYQATEDVIIVPVSLFHASIIAANGITIKDGGFGKIYPAGAAGLWSNAEDIAANVASWASGISVGVPLYMEITDKDPNYGIPGVNWSLIIPQVAAYARIISWYYLDLDASHGQGRVCIWMVPSDPLGMLTVLTSYVNAPNLGYYGGQTYSQDCGLFNISSPITMSINANIPITVTFVNHDLPSGDLQLRLDFFPTRYAGINSLGEVVQPGNLPWVYDYRTTPPYFSAIISMPAQGVPTDILLTQAIAPEVPRVKDLWSAVLTVLSWPEYYPGAPASVYRYWVKDIIRFA